mmetsp:Transcript_102515/g.299052  ORF Transcript_102515/g.299052 Transcript_102515/m.299052 type:complete len:274 (+) Transcript_102515:655-1476(+)
MVHRREAEGLGDGRGVDHGPQRVPLHARRAVRAVVEPRGRRHRRLPAGQDLHGPLRLLRCEAARGACWREPLQRQPCQLLEAGQRRLELVLRGRAVLQPPWLRRLLQHGHGPLHRHGVGRRPQHRLHREQARRQGLPLQGQRQVGLHHAQHGRLLRHERAQGGEEPRGLQGQGPRVLRGQAAAGAHRGLQPGGGPPGGRPRRRRARRHRRNGGGDAGWAGCRGPGDQARREAARSPLRGGRGCSGAVPGRPGGAGGGVSCRALIRATSRGCLT